MNFAARKPVEFTPIPMSYTDLVPYLLDNSVVSITPAKVHQPLFLREYDSNATCACHGEAPGRSIEHCRAPKRKVQGLIDTLRRIVCKSWHWREMPHMGKFWKLLLDVSNEASLLIQLSPEYGCKPLVCLLKRPVLLSLDFQDLSIRDYSSCTLVGAP